MGVSSVDAISISFDSDSEVELVPLLMLKVGMRNFKKILDSCLLEQVSSKLDLNFAVHMLSHHVLCSITQSCIMERQCTENSPFRVSLFHRGWVRE